MLEEQSGLRERQESELEVLKAIFLELKDLREDLKLVDSPPYFSIKLTPQRSDSFSPGSAQDCPTFIFVIFKIPPDYPLKIPDIIFAEKKGISNQNADDLNLELLKIATQKLGEVMILDLIQHIETYLYKNHKVTGSFYDEMLKNKELEQHNAQLQKSQIEEKERLAIIEEIKRKQEILQQEAKERKIYLKSQHETDIIKPLTSPPNSPTRGSDPMFELLSKKRSSLTTATRRRRSTSESSNNDISSESEARTIDFTINKNVRQYTLGELLGESNRGTKIFAAMNCKNGNLISVVEWKFHLKCDKIGKIIRSTTNSKNSAATVGEIDNFDQLVKHINSFEPEFNLLQKLDHPNINLYHGFKIDHENYSKLIVYIAQDFLRGVSLKSYLQEHITLDFSLIRHISEGILQGLNYLHSNNIVHRYLRDTSVFLDQQGVVKLSDYGIERKVCELYLSTYYGDKPVIVDKFSPSIGRGAKKTDVYRFGVLILSLMQGRYVNEHPPKIPSSLPKELENFLTKCLLTNEQERWTCSQLLEHSYIKMTIQKSPNMQLGKCNGFGLPKIEKEHSDEGNDSILGLAFQSQSIKGHSRLQSEFEILKWLGKGGFGDVLKVKNKLDAGIYAIKRIKLNPKNKLLNKKITREVKLLSRLNHENVVRYYNSWVETVVGKCETTTSDTSIATVSNNHSVYRDNHVIQPHLNINMNSLGFDDNIEDLAPPVQMSESDWNVSILENEKRIENESDESSEDEDIFGTSFICLPNEEDSSGDVVFENNKTSYSSEDDDGEQEEKMKKIQDKIKSLRPTIKDFEGTTESECSGSVETETQFMYIQMEFCERSTLRQAIDTGLHNDQERMWRLFREIIEGMIHIHKQGMIHRDLKPVNIFLDSFDHVKIGDFGLATTNILAKVPHHETTMNFDKMEPNQSIDFGDASFSLTGQVGTALYVAPELLGSKGKAIYNQKVDVFSLGIVFFEMIYPPLDTAMERVRVIINLRQKSQLYPTNFDQMVTPQQKYIISWLLHHDPKLRPTLTELLQSDYMPPVMMEENELQEILRHTLANSQSKAYKYLISSCFQQNCSIADSITYNYNYDSSTKHHGIIDQSLLLRRTIRLIQNVFERHGALLINTPLLMIKSDIYDQETCVHLMSNSGSILTIPFDLRVPFARFLAWNNSLTNVKRYSIEKVYRNRKVHGFHPRELNEIAFDITTSQASSIADAEILSTVFEIINEIPWILDKCFTIRLGHTYIFEALLLHFGIDKKFHVEIKNIIAEMKAEKNSKSQVQTHLVSLCLPEQFISTIFNLMEVEGSLQKVAIFLTSIIRKREESSSYIKTALYDLEHVISNIESFNLKCKVIIAPILLFSTKIYDGLIFQVVCDLKKRKNKFAMDIIAAGGRYNSIIKKYRTELEMTGLVSPCEFNQFSVGISISLDKLTCGLHEEEIKNIGWNNKSVDVIICSLGHHPHQSVKEKISLLKEFWANGIKCSAFDGSHSQESVEDYSREIGATYIVVILKESEIFSNLLVRFLEKDRFTYTEKKLPRSEAVELVLKNCRANYSTEGSRSHEVAGSLIKSENTVSGSSIGIGSSNTTSTSSSRLLSQPSSSLTERETIPQANYQQSGGAGNLPSVNISFVTPEREKFINWKRRYETQIMSHIIDILPKLSRTQIIELIGIDADSHLVNGLSSYLKLGDKDEFNKSVVDVIERNPKQKKYLKSICDEIFVMNFKKNASVIIIYGLVDNSFKLLL